MGGQMSCSSPHPPSEASDRAAAAPQAQAYHKHKQKDGSSSHTGSNAHLITQRLIKLASKNAGSGSGSGSQAALHDKQASAGSSSQSQSQSLTQSLTLPHHQQSSNGAANGTGTGTRAIPLSHPALSHSSAQQAFQSHTQPTVRPQSAQAPSQPDPQPPTQQQPTHPLRSSNSYQTLGPMVYVCCATSRIGIATIRGLRMNYPGIKIRAGVGMYENKSEVHRMFRDAHLDEIDCVQVDPRKRQSLIWALVGVQALLVIPDAETNVRTALAHVQAAKTAGVALVTVVTKPKPPDKANTNTNSNTNTNTNSIDPKKAAPTESTPHVVERYTLKTKLGCCFMRLPLDLVDDIVCPPPPAGSVTVSSPSDGVLAGAPKFHLSDVGTACATILANHQQHVFTRYDLEVADADNKRKYQESLEQQQLQLQQQQLLQQQQQQLLRHGSGAGTPTQIGGMDDHDSSQPSTPDSCNRGGTKSRRGSTASTITDVSDRSNSSTPEHSRTHCRHVNPSHHHHHHHHHHYEQHHRSRSNSSDEHSPHHHSPGRVH